MKRMRAISLIAMVCSIFAMPVLAAEMTYTSVLSGTVVQVIPVGTAVREGEVLVTVQSLAGPMAAARASGNGTVKSVSVAPGEQVQQGTAVMVIETK